MKQSTWKREESDPILFLDEISIGPSAAENLAKERVERMDQLTQKQMFYGASKNASACDMLFLEFIEEGMTKQELQTNIDRSPALWGKYSGWLDRLPSEPQVGDDITVVRANDDLGLSQEVSVIGKAMGKFVVKGSSGEKFVVNIHEVQQ